MEYTIAMGVWAVTIAAPCLASWLAGDFNGAARMRRDFETAAAGKQAIAPGDRMLRQETVRQETVRPSDAQRFAAGRPAIGAPALAVPHPVQPGAVPGDQPAALTIEEQVRAAEERHLQRRAMMQGDAAPVRTRRGEHHGSEKVAKSAVGASVAAGARLAEDHEIERMLDHYERSIRMLEQARAEQSAQGSAGGNDPLAEGGSTMLTQMPQWDAALWRVH